MSEHSGIGKLAVVVLSCDKYSDLWDGFFHCFFKLNPFDDCDFYLVSNQKTYDFHGIKNILVGPDVDWSTSVLSALDKVPNQKLFVILEDIYVTNIPSRASLLKCAERFLLEDIKHLKYFNSPKPDKFDESPSIGQFEASAPFRCTVCGFWEKETLQALLIEGESPWMFEVMGSYRSFKYRQFFGVKKNLINYKNMVEKGRWIGASVKWAVENDVPLKIETRHMPSIFDLFTFHLKKLVFGLVTLVNWRFRTNAMNILRKILVSY